MSVRVRFGIEIDDPIPIWICPRCVVSLRAMISRWIATPHPGTIARVEPLVCTMIRALPRRSIDLTRAELEPAQNVIELSQMVEQAPVNRYEFMLVHNKRILIGGSYSISIEEAPRS